MSSPSRFQFGRKLLSWSSISLFIALSLGTWTACRNQDPAYKEETAGALTDLKSIGFSLRQYSLELAKPVEQLIACAPDGTEEVQIVSAEKVLLPLFRRFGEDESFLTSPIYEQKIPPANPHAATISGKWGSSYNMWCMSAEHWRRTKWFVWYSDDKYQGLDFPWVWAKEPELYGGKVNLLLGDGSCHSVPTNVFVPYLEHAKKWVAPAGIRIEDVLKDLRETSDPVRANALSLLGVRKETNQIAEVIVLLNDQSAVVKHAAEGALVLIGEDAVPLLQRQTNSSSLSVRHGVVNALDRIGGSVVVPALAAFLDDSDSSVRKIAVQGLANSGSDAAWPFLRRAVDDTDSDVRTAARKALHK